MVNKTEKGRFMIIKEARDGKFAEAINDAINDGWQIVNVVRQSNDRDHVGYLTRK